MTASTSSRIIDLRALPPQIRHAEVFESFRALGAGQSVELVNDHDPLPLKHQFDAAAPGRFGWEYLERGPAAWRVAITRLPRSEGDCCGGCCGG